MRSRCFVVGWRRWWLTEGAARARSSASASTRSTRSNHYTAQPITAESLTGIDRATMTAFYRERFRNAADFTVFMVGAFTLDRAVPLLAQYVGIAAVNRLTRVDVQGRGPSLSDRRHQRRRQGRP